MSRAAGKELHRCAWCGVASSSTTGAGARLVPMPLGMVEWCADYERRHGARLRHDDYAVTGSPSPWWCRSAKSCARRRGGVAELGTAPAS